MTVKDTVKNTITKLENLRASYEKNPFLKLDDLDQTVDHLSQEVQAINLAADQNLKTELNILQSSMLKLFSVLKEQQKNLEKQAQELSVHQRALQAYASVANNN
ncbi:MAG: hypothetical protein ACD_16C00033G0010 [uncultured bacterium]|nr:MAG: hypothetical protein ACD_16C00033G0010 [uncultured bacterium]OFW68256.1 MAG: hypothetical protein A2X70_06425 [Alphaproteobacteria bacterium GWC2_42_16]OFW74748.1 MAG: hypothetical protein A2Z80_02695 [Alphaproteobacteria bacterium GWA2_41_27]OFW85050.1 MAG: hypothetical protein A3E50_05620 [Alphaproteobacteria bacterium RIFCSPHIGHO2_12_FULL_42_100]OFW85636.1 MAG: hypothetical protein A2W06_01695 [Alphaproteobacteria bacterium RBG_16_42_14]OFW92476.1 MAG: hypothetical protein A2W46_023